MNEQTVVLIDLSSISHPIWHTSQSEPDPNTTSVRVVARVRALATGHPSVAICCDEGKSFRKVLAADYTGQRPESDARLQHQIALARETLVGDGFPVWGVKGFEADDLLASGTTRLLEMSPDLHVRIISGDKDLTQLSGPRVTVVSSVTGAIFDPDGVKAKFGVEPSQMCDYLSLVGDASDNIKGAKGIGSKRAAELLTRFGSLDKLFAALAEQGVTNLGLQPSVAASLEEFRSRWPTVRALITLRTDVDLPLHELARDRVPADVAAFQAETEEQMAETTTEGTIDNAPIKADTQAFVAPTSDQLKPIAPPSTSVTVREPVRAELVTTGEWGMQLEPRSMLEAKQLAVDIYASRLFSQYGTPQAVLAVVLAGRELGLQAMAALRGMHIIDGKPALSADLIRALVIRSGAAKYFRCSARSATSATFETQRGDDPPMSLTFTIEEARTAWSKSDAAWKDSGWGKNSADMVVARAGAKLARLVYPDIVFNIYESSEIE